MIVTVNHTVMDGQVARWYPNESAAIGGAETISASRNGVVGGQWCYLTPDVFEAAWAAHVLLKNRQDVKDIATHERSFRGELTAIPERTDVAP